MSRTTQARVFEFTKSGSPVQDPVAFQAAAASALKAAPDGATFVAMRTERGLRHLMVTDDSPGQERIAFGVATAIHADSKELDETPDLSEVSSLAKLWWGRRHSKFGASNMAGADVSTLAQIIGQTLQQGEWVAMSIRDAKKRESRWNALWVRHNSGGLNHQSLSHNSKVISIWGGGIGSESGNIVKRIAAALPGFGIDAQVRKVSGLRENRFVFLGGAGATAPALLARQVHDAWPAIPGPGYWAWLLGAGIGVLVYGLLASGVIPGAPILPGRWKTLRTALQWGRVPAARIKYSRPDKPVQGKMLADGSAIVEKSGDYPLKREAFLTSAHYPCLLVNPHAGAFGGTGRTTSRPAPPVLRDPNIGIEVGVNEDAPVFLSDADLWAGLFIAGIPGSGKTRLLEWIFGQSVYQITCGKRMTSVAFDTKLDGQMSVQLSAWSREHGVVPHEFHVSDTYAGVAIELFPRVGSISQQARRTVDAFVYLYGEQSVGARSQDTLVRIMSAALTLTPEQVRAAQTGPAVNPDGSPFHFAYAMLGGFGDDAGLKLARQLQNLAASDGTTQEIREAASGLGPIYDPSVTVAKRRELCEAPRNKVSALITMEHWWAAPKKYTWGELLEQHIPVIVNSGMAPNGQKPSDQQIVDQMSALTVYTLRQAIQDHCAGWQADGRSVRIFSDEVKAIAATSPEVIAWLRSDGRAYGVEAIFATQYPGQLHPEVRAAAMSFGALIAFAQNEEQPATEIARNLALDGGEWTVQDVTTLAKFTAITRVTVDQGRLPAFTMTIPDFRSRRQIDEPSTQPLRREVEMMEASTMGNVGADGSEVAETSVADKATE